MSLNPHFVEYIYSLTCLSRVHTHSVRCALSSEDSLCIDLRSQCHKLEILSAWPALGAGSQGSGGRVALPPVVELEWYLLSDSSSLTGLESHGVGRCKC